MERAFPLYFNGDISEVEVYQPVDQDAYVCVAVVYHKGKPSGSGFSISFPRREIRGRDDREINSLVSAKMKQAAASRRALNPWQSFVDETLEESNSERSEG